MVELLERLSYCAESRRKVVSTRLGFAMQRMENSVFPAVNCTFFELWKDKATKGEA